MILHTMEDNRQEEQWDNRKRRLYRIRRLNWQLARMRYIIWIGIVGFTIALACLAQGNLLLAAVLAVITVVGIRYALRLR
jgi:hypothetical protein